MRHGYFIARQSRRFGDAYLAGAAMLAWRSLHRRSASTYDGASVVLRDDGSTEVLVTTKAAGALPACAAFRGSPT